MISAEKVNTQKADVFCPRNSRPAQNPPKTRVHLRQANQRSSPSQIVLNQPTSDAFPKSANNYPTGRVGRHGTLRRHAKSRRFSQTRLPSQAPIERVTVLAKHSWPTRPTWPTRANLSAVPSTVYPNRKPFAPAPKNTNLPPFLGLNSRKNRAQLGVCHIIGGRQYTRGKQSHVRYVAG